MNKYLIEILKIRTSVILPGFGALMIANKRTGKIVINQLLKFDDGILADYICEQEGVDKTEAKNMISKFIREIESVIGKGETYDIFQFGKISKNEKGDINFEMDASLLKVQDSPISKPKTESKPKIKEETKPVNTFVPPVDSVKKEVSKKEVVKEEKKSAPKKEEKTVSKDSENSYVPPVKEAVKEKAVIEKDDKKAEKVNAEKIKKEAKDLELKKKKAAKELEAKKKQEAKVLAAKKKDKIKKEKLAAKKKPVSLDADGKPVKKKKKKLIPLLLLLICVGGLGFGGFKYQNKIKEMLGMSHVANHSDDTVHNDTDDNVSDEHDVIDEHDAPVDTEETDSDESIESDEQVVEEIVEDVVEDTPVETHTVAASINGSYHIIGGGFGVESNAIKYAEKHGGTVLGRFDSLYLVALKSYDSRADAKADLSNIQSISSSAWIFKYSK